MTSVYACCRSNRFGVLGYGDQIDRTEPTHYVNVDPEGRPVQIAAGGFHTCVVLDTGS